MKKRCQSSSSASNHVHSSCSTQFVTIATHSSFHSIEPWMTLSDGIRECIDREREKKRKRSFSAFDEHRITGHAILKYFSSLRRTWNQGIGKVKLQIVFSRYFGSAPALIPDCSRGMSKTAAESEVGELLLDFSTLQTLSSLNWICWTVHHSVKSQKQIA